MKKEDLPKILPVFPLSNFIIFPRTTVPLNIFEPRYIQMIDQSTMTDIQMISPDILAPMPSHPILVTTPPHLPHTPPFNASNRATNLSPTPTIEIDPKSILLLISTSIIAVVLGIVLIRYFF